MSACLIFFFFFFTTMPRTISSPRRRDRGVAESEEKIVRTQRETRDAARPNRILVAGVAPTGKDEASRLAGVARLII